jgi:hypothetical protein
LNVAEYINSSQHGLQRLHQSEFLGFWFLGGMKNPPFYYNVSETGFGYDQPGRMRMLSFFFEPPVLIRRFHFPLLPKPKKHLFAISFCSSLVLNDTDFL